MSVDTAKKSENSIERMLAYTLNGVMELADANSVLGERIEVGSTTIIPVSKISVGFAGGGADMVNAGKKKRQVPAGSGGSVTVTPLTFLVIDEDGVKTVNVKAEKKPSTAAEVVVAVMEQLKSMKADKKQPEKESEN